MNIKKNIAVTGLIIALSGRCLGQCSIGEVKGFRFLIAKKEYDFTAKHYGDFHELSSPFGTDTLTFVYGCKNDTMYCTRKPLAFNSQNTAFMIFGVQKLPMRLEIGQSIEPVSDFFITAPPSETSRGNVNTMYSSFYQGTNYDVITTTIKTFNVATKSTVNVSTEYVSFMNSKVVAVEDVIIGEKTFKAYKVDYEIWVKQNMNVKFEYDTSEMGSSDKAQVEKQNAKINKRLEKMMAKNQRLATGGKGYTITPRTDWYVPGLGWVKALTYNSGRMIEMDKAAMTSLFQ